MGWVGKGEGGRGSRAGVVLECNVPTECTPVIIENGPKAGRMRQAIALFCEFVMGGLQRLPSVNLAG